MAPSDQTAVRNPLSLSFGNVYGDGRYEGMALATVDPELSEDLFSLHLRVAYVLNQHQPCGISSALSPASAVWCQLLKQMQVSLWFMVPQHRCGTRDMLPLLLSTLSRRTFVGSDVCSYLLPRSSLPPHLLRRLLLLFVTVACHCVLNGFNSDVFETDPGRLW